MATDEMRRYVAQELGNTNFPRSGIVFGTSPLEEGNELCIADYPTACLSLYGTDDGKQFWIRRDVGFTDCACETSSNIGSDETGIKDLDTAIAVFRTCLMMEANFADYAGGNAVHPDKGRFEELVQLERAGKLKLT